MKAKKLVYLLNSLKQEEFIIYSSKKKAKERLENFNKNIFDKSTKEDLYITERVVF